MAYLLQNILNIKCFAIPIFILGFPAAAFKIIFACSSLSEKHTHTHYKMDLTSSSETHEIHRLGT